MKFFRRFLLVPAAVAVVLVEIFYFIGLVLWVIGWPYGQRLQSDNNYNGLWDDNAPAIFYFVLLAVLVLGSMVLLPLTLIPFWKGYISRWAITGLIPGTLWILYLLTNVLYATVRFIPLDCSDLSNGNTNATPGNVGNDDRYDKFCIGSKIIFSSTMVWMFTAAVCIGYLMWLLQESLFQGIRTVHKRAKGRDAKMETVRRAPVEVERETVTTAGY